jgi:hypothetical protein
MEEQTKVLIEDAARMQAALDLLRAKAIKRQQGRYSSEARIDEDDINEILVVAGMPEIAPKKDPDTDND